MAVETEVAIYYGPPSWFHQIVGDAEAKNFVTLVSEADEIRRRLRVVVPGEAEDQPAPNPSGPDLAVAESSDYASLQEHVITNFANLVAELRPKKLMLNNPPTRVHEQLMRTSAGTSVEYYTYPTVTTETLRNFVDGFAEHLVGQEDVRDTMLSTLYPLTRPGRKEPVVVMLYGPSGVGKTETALFVNSLLGGELMRKQFSMFHSDKFTSYLFGGGHSEASLARDFLDRESGVILIDEFDKAHPVFHSAFYQLFDSGQFVDKNYTVEIGPSLIICTSNYGSEDEIRGALGDALASRFDALIEFVPLTAAEISQVIERILAKRIGELSQDEMVHIDHELIRKQLLESLGHATSNVRQLGKIIDSTISLVLVRAVIENSAGASS